MPGTAVALARDEDAGEVELGGAELDELRLEGAIEELSELARDEEAELEEG